MTKYADLPESQQEIIDFCKRTPDPQLCAETFKCCVATVYRALKAGNLYLGLPRGRKHGQYGIYWGKGRQARSWAHTKEPFRGTHHIPRPAAEVEDTDFEGDSDNVEYPPSRLRANAEKRKRDEQQIKANHVV